MFFSSCIILRLLVAHKLTMLEKGYPCLLACLPNRFFLYLLLDALDTFANSISKFSE